MFTFSTFSKKSWSPAYNSIQVIDRKVTVKTHAIIAGISEENGLEAYLIYPKSIKTEEYLAFLEKLHDKYGGRRIILFIDNLQVHKTNEARDAYA